MALANSIIVFLIPATIAFRIKLNASHSASARSVTTSALELCGTAKPATLLWLDKACPSPSGPGGSDTLKRAGPGLEPITTDNLQPGGSKYRLPAYRLYICNPASPKRGFLFSQLGFEAITTADRMGEVADLLMTNSLWDFEDNVFVKPHTDWWKEKKRGVAMLWVLDTGGNLVIAPEVQDVMVKHGDLVPGDTPISEASQMTTSRRASCCCIQTTTCNYIKVGTTTCCKYLPGTCAQERQTSQTACNESPAWTAYAETRNAGDYRGLARGAGELRFDDEVPLFQDKSSYTFQRVRPRQLMSDGEFDEDKLRSVQKIPEPHSDAKVGSGACAMSRFREYFAAPLRSPHGRVGLGLSDSDVDFGSVGWDDDEVEQMTPVG